jgi:hypothetical protein
MLLSVILAETICLVEDLITDSKTACSRYQTIHVIRNEGRNLSFQ